MIRSALFVLGIATLPLGPAMALDTITRPILKPAVQVLSGVVTLGDLFDNAGTRAETPIFLAPAAGSKGLVSAEAIQKAVTAAGIDAVDLGGLHEVPIERLGRVLEASEIEASLETALRTRLDAEPGMLDINFSDIPRSIVIPAENIEPVHIATMNVARNGRFEAHLRITGRRDLVKVTGQATRMVTVPMLVRPIARGDRIGEEAIAMRRVPETRQGQGSTVTDMADIIGMAASRTLRAGTTIEASDITRPMLVERNAIVSITFRSGALTLSSRGRALESGSEGEGISVINLQSRRTVRATITDYGVVTVTPGGADLASLSGRIQ